MSTNSGNVTSANVSVLNASVVAINASLSAEVTRATNSENAISANVSLLNASVVSLNSQMVTSSVLSSYARRDTYQSWSAQQIFNSNIASAYVDSLSQDSNLFIGDNQTTGILVIGDKVDRTGRIYIGNRMIGDIYIGSDLRNGSNIYIGSYWNVNRLGAMTTIGGGQNMGTAMLNVTTQDFNRRDGIAIRSSAQNDMYYVTFLNQANGIIGKIRGYGGSVGYDTTSDRRLKKDVTPIQNGLENIMKLKPSNYTFIQNNQSSFGFIAQEVYEVFPEMRQKGTNTDDNLDEPCDKDTGEPDYYGLDYGRFTPFIVKAIQEMKLDYESKLSALEERIRQLETQNN
jgi:hypothetical protein